MERVSRHVEAHPGECTKDGLTKEVTGKKTYLRMAVDILTDEGFLIVGPGKRSGSRVYTSVRPYREADDHSPTATRISQTDPPRNMTSEPAGGGVG